MQPVVFLLSTLYQRLWGTTSLGVLLSDLTVHLLSGNMELTPWKTFLPAVSLFCISCENICLHLTPRGLKFVAQAAETASEGDLATWPAFKPGGLPADIQSSHTLIIRP